MMLKQMMLSKRLASPSLNVFSMLRASFTSRVFVEGLPLEMSHHDIAQHFTIAGAVLKVNLVKNALGHNTGKAIVTFEQDSSALNAQEKYDNIAVESVVCRVKPYYDKKGESPRKALALLARRVYLMNLPYDAT